MDGVAWLRAYALAATLALVSVGGHVAAGGRLPSFPAVAAVVAVCGVLGRMGAARDWSALRLVLLISAAQVVFHLIFVGMSLRSMSGGQSMSGMDGMAMTGSMSPVAAQDMSLQATGLMVLGHAAAALMSSLLLVHADRAFARLMTLARRAGELCTALVGLTIVGPTPVTPPRLVAAGQPAGYRDAERTHQMRRRGPPQLHSI